MIAIHHTAYLARSISQKANIFNDVRIICLRRTNLDNLQTDAYEGYATVCRKNSLISVGCMAHARRKFDEALKTQSAVNPEKPRSTLAATALKYIQTLYRIERDIKLPAVFRPMASSGVGWAEGIYRAVSG